MRRKDREITGLAEIMEILSRCQVCRLGMCQKGMPYVVPLNFGVEREGERLVLYFHGAREGKKLDIIRENPQVCVEFDGEHRLLEGETACAHSFAYESVIGFGKAEILESHEEKAQGLAAILRSLTGKEFTFTPEQTQSVAVLRMALEEVAGKRRSAPA
ncbi:pyridoxamine 5'-phosphate oxidase family protein [Acutalibacter sp.]|uniref:pyridoxamine 5'-phosphate oxidase family protein n=1 Tax=Acutalibacter sp. TaxID=1918636 RepID=UPI00216EB768|nr:pyridoxamine 5'-phosphate oxidase family protein [Acutalibacter sp.]